MRIVNREVSTFRFFTDIYKNMKKILAFGASSSRNSINKQLATWASGQISDAAVTMLDLNDFEMPIFSVDREREDGIHELAKQFKAHIENHDGIIISYAEHNGVYSAAFKNVMDWASRLEGKLWAGKPMLLLATSPGGRGGKSVLELAKVRVPFEGGNLTASFSLPRFRDNFYPEDGISEPDLRKGFEPKKSSCGIVSPPRKRELHPPGGNMSPPRKPADE